MIRKVQYESQERLTLPVLLSLSRRAARVLLSALKLSVSVCRLSASPEVWLTTAR